MPSAEGTPELTQAEIDALLHPPEHDGIGGANGVVDPPLYSVCAEFTPPSTTFTTSTLTISNVVSISLKDGALTRLDAWTNDDAAAIEFWAAVSLLFPFSDSSNKLLTTARTLAAYALNAAYGATLQPFEVANITELAKSVGCTVGPRQHTDAVTRCVLNELLVERRKQLVLGYTAGYDDAHPLHGRMDVMERLNDPNYTRGQLVEAATLLVAEIERVDRVPVFEGVRFIPDDNAVPPVEIAPALNLTHNGHVFYEQGDLDAPDCIKDRNGDIWAAMCRVCGAVEIEIEVPCTGEKLDRNDR